MSEQLALLPDYLTAHLQLALMALLFGVALSLPLGVLAARTPRLEGPVLGLASIIQTIPSLALLAIMVPLLAALGLQSIGFLPAFIALVLYSILPILRNTVTGLASTDPALVEAARGVGMTRRQRLFRVELPLALPFIIAGIRTATVWTVGIATLSTPVGAVSLGNYIFSGLQTRNFAAVLVGCIAAAALALTLDGLIRVVAMGVERRRPRLLALGLTILAALYLYTGITLAQKFMGPGPERIRVGAKTFTEQYILSEVLAGQITHQTGLSTEVAQSLGSTVAFDALRNDEIQVYVDYSGTIWSTIMHRDSYPENRDQMLAELTRFVGERYGIGVVGALGFENAYVIAMARRRAQALGVTTISELTTIAPRLSLGADYEFFGRPEWPALRDAYGLRFATTRSMDSSLMAQAAAQASVDAIAAFSTDGRIEALNLVVLDDDRGAIGPYDALILVSPGLQEQHPEVVAALEQLTGTLDDQRMGAMNLAVDQAGESPGAVARRFLAELWDAPLGS